MEGPVEATARRPDRDFCVGDRVKSDGAVATVRYIGSVDGQDPAKEWVGVEWDELGRGKHDGTAGGTRHFVCQPSQGSFLKARKIDAKETLSGYLVYRYCGGGTGGDAADSRRSRAVVVDSRSRTEARFVGMEQLAAQQSDLKKLAHVALLDAGISCLNWADQLTVAELAPNIEELDLAGNLLNEWHTVELLGRQLPKLRSLDLRGNRLHTNLPSSEVCFGQLQVLVLNDTRMSWEATVLRAHQMPRLAELHVARNQIKSLSTSGIVPHEVFTSVEYVDLDKNQISDWSEVQRLSHLPCLQKLTLSENMLETISIGEADNMQHSFSKLHSLSVNSNALGADRIHTSGSGWSSIVALDSLPALTNLRCSGNPLFEGLEPAASRNLIIGRLHRVCALDGSAILVTDRVMAEKQYLRQCYVEVSERGRADEEFKLCHPRFEALNELYEDVRHEKHGVDAQQSRLSSNLIEISIRSSIDSHAGTPAVVKRLALTMTVGKLKALCHRLFKVKGGPRRMQLVYTAAGDCRETPLDGWDLNLQYYSMETGGTIIVSQK